MKSRLLLTICLLQGMLLKTLSQPSYTADENVVAFDAPFGYGVNPGYYGDIATGSGFDREGVSYDVALAQLARNAGINSWRPTLPAYFFLQYGNSPDLGLNNFNLRINEFSEYKKMGILNNVVFIGEATDHQDGSNAPTLAGNVYRNLVKYEGCEKYSYEFKNMYEPIWDGGANGTPVNDNNFYALYVYKVAMKYKDFIKVYEVVNEIDFPGTNTVDPSAKPGGNNGNNWFDRNPTPCELLNWRAPIYSYIRMLRITYEVVKTVNPSAFVAIGGIGYESFLDVVLRNTDNPSDGSINATSYPKTGGAYFDVVSYHIYPQFDLKKKNANGDNIYPFIHQRYSDEATERVVNKKDKMQTILTKYKYDGSTHPLKHFIVTETNIPRRTYAGEDWIGSDDAQRNFAVKVMVKAQKKGIKQLHLFALGESSDLTDESNKEGHEGLYLNLKTAKRTTATKTPAGTALTTTAGLLDSLTYDEAKTLALSLPATVDGAAFKTIDGKHIYILWAKTTVDNSEVASATYSFPASFGISNVIRVEWNFVSTGEKKKLLASNISLVGSPSYFTDDVNGVNFNKSLGLPDVVTEVGEEIGDGIRLTAYPNPSNKDITFTFSTTTLDVFSLELLTIEGALSKMIISENELAPGDHKIMVDNTVLASGIYIARLKSKLTGRTRSVKVVVWHNERL